MNFIVVQMLVRENSDGTIRSFIGPVGQTDATDVILNYADTNGFKVLLGTYSPNWNHDMLASNFLFATQSKMAEVAQQAWNRYLAGQRHPSFAGWYIPYEPWTADYKPDEVARLRKFVQLTREACRQISGETRLALSPFISAQRPPPCQVEQIYRQILDQSGLDLLLLQDSVGAQQWESDIPQHVRPYFQAFQAACAATGVRLWANLESFRITPTNFVPCDITRFREQFDATAPFVEQFITFDYFHYLNPVAFLSGWDADRRSLMQRLYADYKTAFVEHDYSPLGPPQLNPTLAGTNLTLSWTGVVGDSYEVQLKTNLVENWRSAGLPIFTNQDGFYCGDQISPSPATRYYRVQRSTRIEAPDSMVWIPPGTFLMGTSPNDTNRTANELPPFQVTLTRGFWISRFEVTQSEYQNVMCTNPATFLGDLRNPVETLTWTQARDYCHRLTQQEHQAGRLPENYFYRLPTEAEWEYVARSGATNLFSFGDDPAQLGVYGWFKDNSDGRVHKGGERRPNSWGVSDMGGNVFEWCWDWISKAPSEPVIDFMGYTNTSFHAIRGGAWSFPWDYCRSSWRTGFNVNNRQGDLGFRVVLTPKP